MAGPNDEQFIRVQTPCCGKIAILRPVINPDGSGKGVAAGDCPYCGALVSMPQSQNQVQPVIVIPGNKRVKASYG